MSDASDRDTGELFTNPLKVREDCKLVARSARAGWPIPIERRLKLLERLYGILDYSEDDSAVIQAAKAVLAADTINQRREAARDARKAAKQSKPGVTVNLTNNTAIQVNQTAAIIQEATKDPAYLEYLEARALAGDCDPGVIRPKGGARLEDEAAPIEDQPAAS